MQKLMVEKKCNEKITVIGRNAALSYFKMNIKSCVVPRKNMVEDAQKKFQVLQKRTWILIKAKAYNLVVYDRKKK